MDDGAEDVGNLNSSVHGKGRNLNVLHCWRFKEDSVQDDQQESEKP